MLQYDASLSEARRTSRRWHVGDVIFLTIGHGLGAVHPHEPLVLPLTDVLNEYFSY